MSSDLERDTKLLLLFLDYSIPCRGRLMHLAVDLAGEGGGSRPVIHTDRSYELLIELLLSLIISSLLTLHFRTSSGALWPYFNHTM